MNLEFFVQLLFLVAAVLFILGMKRLSSPETARSGNIVAAIGMGIALLAVLPLLPLDDNRLFNYGLMALGIAIGSLVGAIGALRVKMTAMPQMVALFNGVGGGAAALIATVEFFRLASGGDINAGNALAMLFATLIGSISFSGSIMAWAKLQGMVERPITYPMQQVVNAALFLAVLGIAGYQLWQANAMLFGIFFAISLVFGVLTVLPIGGADMPVVISLLNSFTGLAVAADGFTISNIALIIGGTLVGSSGTLLTIMMCKAMNRPITNVLFGAFGKVTASAGGGASAEGKTVKPIQADEAAILMGYAQLVIIVPGYGMAVAQAQHAVREMADALSKSGVEVKYAIHPVAGRMPGHMNVLLAEANVPYDQLYEMEQINNEFERADVALIIGANDVVNPAARSDRSSPIYGMPILNADHAKNIIVLKRSMNPGFAGIENELFYNEKTRMLFGDAKDSVTKLVQELKKMSPVGVGS
ncbi:NAD(P)(+) transhydrogenase (Re/Si-specific) subunit beta [Candidatus Acetothermia bacterium]|nr:NAD(P)(+) transhydrogenase (Re/Si-specific) subunit beta [Candidatus Acetothermia bacterium]MBI3460478.1 NAD(P)(+) transhydrogenase (Re/Si-specific) subunit beta [Candidatus Acetothermia bacterium]MBI3660595.1 NAD(P)(+) transhydrogenase (Re/Si-specific) subunit beta [Candidatus Acetothermia bacterium]